MIISVVKKQPLLMGKIITPCQFLQREAEIVGSHDQIRLDLFSFVIYWSRIFKMERDYFLYFYIKDLVRLLMALPRKAICSESEHFALISSFSLSVTFIEIKSLQIALQIHCAFPYQACETINICTLAARFLKFLQNLYFSPHFCSFYRQYLIPFIPLHREQLRFSLVLIKIINL